MEEEAKLIITWDRGSGEAKFYLVGMSHVEAQRLLQGMIQANLEHALAEAAGLHQHDHNIAPALLPGRGEKGNT